jgi:hypothetical protein
MQKNTRKGKKGKGANEYRNEEDLTVSPNGMLL